MNPGRFTSVTNTSGPDRFETIDTTGRHTTYHVYIDDVDRIHTNVTELDDGTFYAEGLTYRYGM